MTESVRMLCTEDGDILIVVEEGELRSPCYEHGLLGIEHETDKAAQALRPGIRGPEGRR
jgi:hypothetical protein